MKHLYVSLIFLTSGCTTIWVPTGTTDLYTLQEAKYLCNNDAYNFLPIKNEVVTENNWQPIPVICEEGDKKNKGKKKKCYVDEYASILNKSTSTTRIIDVNENSRVKYFDQCLIQKGWQEKKKFIWQ